MHVHEEEPVVVVTEGEFDFTIATETRTMRPVDVAVIPSWVPHGARTGDTSCKEIDMFAPPRMSSRGFTVPQLAGLAVAATSTPLSSPQSSSLPSGGVAEARNARRAAMDAAPFFDPRGRRTGQIAPMPYLKAVDLCDDTLRTCSKPTFQIRFPKGWSRGRRLRG